MLYARCDKDKKEKQTLQEHSENVAKTAGNFMKSIHLSACAYVVGWLHDYGKSLPIWQEYLFAIHPKEKISHAPQSARLLYRLANCEAKETRLAAEILLPAIWGHHGGLKNMLDVDGENLYAQLLAALSEAEKQLGQEDIPFFEECRPKDDIKKELYAAKIEIEQAFAKIEKGFSHYTGGREKRRACMLACGLLARLFNSVLIDADRMDAAKWETGLFEKERTGEELWEKMNRSLENRLKDFRQDKGKLTMQRSAISEQCLEAASREPGIYRLFVPTGGGKTLAGFRFALKHAQYYKKKRIFYIAPYTTILDQTAQEVRKAIGDKDGAKRYVMELHCNLMQESRQQEEKEELRRWTERFNAPLVLTTMVAFLNSLFSGKSGDIRRMHALCESVILIDEVQSVPVKCLHLFNIALQFLNAVCGCTIVLCSATQPPLEDTKYPLAFAKQMQLTKNTSKDLRAFARTKVIDARKGKKLSAVQLADMIQEKAGQGGLVILNTKRAAARVFEELRVRGLPELYHLSNAMCPAHRLKIMGEIKRKLKEKLPVICISTNLIEAGVDISFPCVIRSLAGLDNIAQAAGRGNRNGEVPYAYVYIVECAEEKIDRITDLPRAQQAAKRVLKEFADMPERFDGDLLSQKSMQLYYTYYFYYQQQEMDYPLSNKETGLQGVSLLDLLGDNAKAVMAASQKKQLQPFLNQSFAAAGKMFHAIEDDTQGVLIPYDETAKALIARLELGRENKTLFEDLQKGQQYTVEMFAYQQEQLYQEGALRKIEPLNIFVLDERWYDKETGVLWDKQLNTENLIY